MKQPGWIVTVTLALVLANQTSARAQAAESANELAKKASELAKTSQNPVGDLTAIPFQYNYFNGGPLDDQTMLNLNFQPVFPLKVNDDWLLIARSIVPYVNLPSPGADSLLVENRVTGIGDIQEQLFFTPMKQGGITWGIGPVFSFPTATNDLLVTGDWAVGPAAVIVKMTGSWVLGGLFTQLWTFAGDDHGPNVNVSALQPFINYNLAHGWAFSFAPIISANWSAPDGEEWTVPLGLGVSRVTAMGRQPINLSLQYYRNVEAPSTTGDNQLRLLFAFLFPSQRG